jgi:hypothetical protein
MMAKADNDGRETTMACKIRWWTTTGKDKSRQQETAETSKW